MTLNPKSNILQIKVSWWRWWSCMVWIKWQAQDYEPNQFLLCLFHFAYNQNNISFKVLWHGLRRFLWNPIDMCNLLELGKISSECKQQLTAEFEFSTVCFHFLIPHFELLSCLKNLSDFFFTVARCDVPSMTHTSSDLQTELEVIRFLMSYELYFCWCNIHIKAQTLY